MHCLCVAPSPPRALLERSLWAAMIAHCMHVYGGCREGAGAGSGDQRSGLWATACRDECMVSSQQLSQVRSGQALWATVCSRNSPSLGCAMTYRACHAE